MSDNIGAKRHPQDVVKKEVYEITFHSDGFKTPIFIEQIGEDFLEDLQERLDESKSVTVEFRKTKRFV